MILHDNRGPHQIKNSIVAIPVLHNMRNGLFSNLWILFLVDKLDF